MKNISAYFNFKMTWPKLILFAVMAGMYTGAIMLVPFLKETSFQDIGISFEWWVIFAVTIVVHCEKNWDAMLKCFVFFLISQPLVYLTEIVSGSMAFEQAWYYYRITWLPLTLLTLPGGFLAYYCKKQDAAGAIILGLGNTIQMLLALAYFGKALKDFPHHLLSGIVCAGSIAAMTLLIQQKKRNRIIAVLVPAALTVACLILLKLTGRVLWD